MPGYRGSKAMKKRMIWHSSLIGSEPRLGLSCGYYWRLSRNGLKIMGYWKTIPAEAGNKNC